MVPVGYLYKKVSSRPDWLNAGQVADVYSLSGHVSDDFADYIPHWRHNGFWLFDSPEVLESVAAKLSIDLTGHSLFFYEAYEQEFDEETRSWSPFQPEASFATRVRLPASKRLEGYDVVTFSCRTSPECSPLSCNSLAEKIAVNRHCLLDSFGEAKRSLEAGSFDHSEPGPFRIFAVYSVARASPPS